MADAPLVIEAVPERLEVKQTVYVEIEAANAEALIASSTSGIMPSDLQAKMGRTERLIVAHPFNPVYLLPLVELVSGRRTDPAMIDRARDLFNGIGMYPLHCRVEIEGFLSDRLQEALWREALWLLKDEVATAQEIDAAIAYGPGLRRAQMGTMQTFHLAGGEGGMRAMLAMFGPCLKWPWTKLMDVPELTDDFVNRVGDQCEAQARGRTPRDLERIRDDNLVAITRALKLRDWGAGAVANAQEARLTRCARLPRRADEIEDPAQTVPTLRRAVPVDWLDYNGHMTEARYLDAFAQATDRLMEIVGCDQDYIATGGSFFTAETHIRHLGEALMGEVIEVHTRVIAAGSKKMHLWHEMTRDGDLLATGEHVLVHVSLETRRPAPPSDEIAANLARLQKAQAGLPAPEGLGRHVGAPR